MLSLLEIFLLTPFSRMSLIMGTHLTSKKSITQENERNNQQEKRTTAPSNDDSPERRWLRKEVKVSPTTMIISSRMQWLPLPNQFQ